MQGFSLMSHDINYSWNKRGKKVVNFRFSKDVAGRLPAAFALEEYLQSMKTRVGRAGPQAWKTIRELKLCLRAKAKPAPTIFCFHGVSLFSCSFLPSLNSLFKHVY